MGLNVKIKKENHFIFVDDIGDIEHGCILELYISDDVKQDEDDIFGSMLTPIDDSGKIVKGYLSKNGEILIKNIPKHFLEGVDKTPFVEEKYPDELVKPIKKNISQSKDFIKKNEIVGLSDEEESILDFEKANHALLQGISTEVEKKNSAMKKQIIKLKSDAGGLNIYSFIDRYIFKKHILIRGERGGGKTYAVDMTARTIPDVEYIFIAGSEGLDTTDLVGYYTRNEDGHMVWLDGVLTEAMRLAKTKKVILFIDELLRIKAKELNILVGTLTPSSIGTYRLKTNRITNVIDSIGSGELIEVPVENFWVVATTNIGSKYNVDDMDSALTDRFRIMDKHIDNSELTTILDKKLYSKSFDMTITNKLLELYTQVNTLFESGELDDKLNIRHLTEVIDFATEASDIKSLLFDLAPYVCSTDVSGSLSKTEKEIFVRLIKRIF